MISGVLPVKLPRLISGDPIDAQVDQGNGLMPSGNKSLFEPMLWSTIMPYGITVGQVSWHIRAYTKRLAFCRWHSNCIFMKEIKNNAWVTVNNNFWVTSGAICQWFSWVMKSRVKIIGKSHHEWPKIVIHGNECFILFLTRYFRSWTHDSAKNNYRSLISPLWLRTVFSDLVFWHHHSWSVTSRERWVLALWRHIHRLFLHGQIGSKGDLHYWITAVNIDFSPSGIHGLACKKLLLWYLTMSISGINPEAV